jgi:hypothetical protein
MMSLFQTWIHEWKKGQKLITIVSLSDSQFILKILPHKLKHIIRFSCFNYK